MTRRCSGELASNRTIPGVGDFVRRRRSTDARPPPVYAPRSTPEARHRLTRGPARLSGPSPSRTRTQMPGGAYARPRVGVATNDLGAFHPSVVANLATRYEAHGEVGLQFRRYLDDGTPGGRRPRDDRPCVAPPSGRCRGTRRSPRRIGGGAAARLGVRVRRPLGVDQPVYRTCLANAVMLDATADASSERQPTAVTHAATLDALKADDGAGGDGRDSDTCNAAVWTSRTGPARLVWYDDPK